MRIRFLQIGLGTFFFGIVLAAGALAQSAGGQPETDLGMELADILFVLIAIANEQGIDLEEAFQRVLEKYRVRDGDRWTPR